MYTTIRKEHWRNWQWNVITDKIKSNLIKKRDALILYLVGPEDKDRETAIKKDFYNHNLIAVDLNEKYVENVRKNSNLAIQGNLSDILAVWPSNWIISAVIADFTSGLDTKTLQTFLTSLFMSRGIEYGKTIIAVNIQRGRDPDSNPLRDFQKSLQEKYKNIRNGTLEIILDNLHRGKQFWFNMLHHCYVSNPQIPSFLHLFLKQTEPVFNSYRQTDQQPFMDSVIFKMPFGIRGRTLSDFEELKALYLEINEKFTCLIGDGEYNLKSKISALRAVRTMKMKSS